MQVDSWQIAAWQVENAVENCLVALPGCSVGQACCELQAMARPDRV